MKALVTGAAGLIGAHIVRALIADGHDVAALVRRDSRRDAWGDQKLTCFVGELPGTDELLDEACAGRDVVFHTAAHFAYGGATSTELHRFAITGTAAVLRACARMGVRRAVVTSSPVVFGSGGRRGSIEEAGPLAGSDGEPAYVAAK